MRRAIALVLVLSLVVLARHLGEGEGRFATMALGFVLIVAALVGEVTDRLNMTRLTGYLLVGFCFGPSLLNIVTPAMANQLRLVNGLATALIAFGAGLELDIAELRLEWRSIIRHGGLLLGLVFGGLFIAVLAATEMLPFAHGVPWPERVGMALVGASVMSTFSPVVAMAVISDTRARGPLSDRVLRLVVMGDLGAVIMFTFATAGAHVLAGHRVDVTEALGLVGWEIFGSVLVGVAVGLGVYAYRRFVNKRVSLVLAGMCVILAEVGTRAGLSPLICCLAAGFIARNLAPEAAAEMDTLLERVRLPVLVVFFAAAGASLQVDELSSIAPFAIGLVIVRGALIVTANGVAARWAAVSPDVARYVPQGLISQAGISLGLAVIVASEFGGWGRAFESLFVAMIALHQFVGPISFRWALQRAGEIPPHEAPVSAAAVEPTA